MSIGFPASFNPSRAALSALAAGIVVLAASPILCAADVARQVHLTARVGPASSLHVSAEQVVFTVLPGQESATATIEYLALVRTVRDAEVVLVLQSVAAIEGAGADAAVSFDSGGGPRGLAPGAPSLAARWIGSGSRRGQIAMTLRAAAGTYVVPIRLQLVTY